MSWADQIRSTPQKTSECQQAALLVAGGEAWAADETALREFPALRAAWSQLGAPTSVVISGRNARRTLLGTPDPGRGAGGAPSARPHRRRAGRTLDASLSYGLGVDLSGD